VRDLRPWFDLYDLTTPVGEVWFSPPDLPLVKFVFTTERLSVQVHPDDAYAARHHSSAGKTEAWYILHAGPGAQLALGFTRALTRDEAEAAAKDGSIEQLVDWRRVHAGDRVFVPAGTVHAIGGGIVLVEIQQVSDLTYRLWDYGRPRELHIGRALDVADLRPYNLTSTDGEVLFDCPYFRLARLSMGAIEPVPHPRMLIHTRGSARIDGHASYPGDVRLLPPETPCSLTGKSFEMLVGSGGAA
jgi:mannose-6-phosphate isomerase